MIGEDFEAVLADAQRGDEAAFARLWRDLNPSLLRYLSLGGDNAEEIAAETWATVVAGLGRFRGDEAGWRGWVFTTARRRAIDAARKRTREHRLGWKASTWMSDEVPDCAEIAADAMSTQDAVALVRRLPAMQAEVVLLRVVADLPVAEVAKLLGRTPGAVRVAAHRGLQTLATMLSDAGVTPGDSEPLRR
ncbi:RNA polymerase sigma24 factor [Intrasporangium oryzae NRRL B-24470]|uniref:RNA polymerase sigma24 factor n=1 Tax=Intrasporangium oryzae NRRL B-24470 TaxID=1386089 RepID=W9GB19_9MICO|nr:sigma-70 family RNA polymerase sigma factor [Intrasporangium oryzae]EWT01998.1 RNA polymerase sigma24 factor [Intrasporangium oryzae NRRL B-24470]